MLILQKLFVQRRSRSDNFNNLALYNAFGELGILHLLANSDAIAFFYQLGNIAVHRMIRHTAHRHMLHAVGALGQR